MGGSEFSPGNALVALPETTRLSWAGAETSARLLLPC